MKVLIYLPMYCRTFVRAEGGFSTHFHFKVFIFVSYYICLSINIVSKISRFLKDQLLTFIRSTKFHYMDYVIDKALFVKHTNRENNYLPTMYLFIEGINCVPIFSLTST